ncbi:MAG: hypothetical protein EA356_02695, partial [Geminicoccaceae bacterium]
MQAYLSKFRIGPRLTFGFSGLLVLLVITALVAGMGLYTAYQSFTEYRHTARQMQQVAGFEGRLNTARIWMKDLYLDRREERIPQIAEQLDAAGGYLRELQAQARQPATLARLESMRGLLATYRQAFDELQGVAVAYNATFERVVQQGYVTETALDALETRLNATTDMEAIVQIADVDNAFSDGRSYVLSYMITYGESGVAGVENNLAAASRNAEALSNRLVGSL